MSVTAHLHRSSFRSVGFALAFAAICFSLVGTLQPRVRQERVELGLSREMEGEASLPPNIVVLHAALGSFRSWVISFMWLRASQLQDRGRLYEAAQIAEWIGQLQPQFERVWDFQAHNLAYNISRLGRNAEERWRWIQAGIDLIRQEGLRTNPMSFGLHRTLAYLFWHKLGRDVDPFHNEYKRLFALRWQALLGEPPAEPAERIARFRMIARASSEGLEELIADLPREPRAADERVLRLTQDPLTTEWGRRREVLVSREPERYEQLLGYLRATALRERFTMDAGLMLDLMEQVAPIDWRHPASHAIYWSAEGVLRRHFGRAKVRLLPDPALRRMILERTEVLAALFQLVFEGRIVHLPELDDFDRGPDVTVLEPFKVARLLEDELGQSSDLDLELYEAVIGQATEACYFEGREADAAVFYEELRRRFGYTGTVTDYLKQRFDREIAQYERPEDAYVGFCVSVLSRGIGRGRLDLAARLYRFIEEHYQTLPGPKPTWPDIEFRATQVYLGSVQRLTSKMRVWEFLSPELRAKIDRVTLIRLYEQATDLDRDPEKVFPGLEQRLGAEPRH